MATSLYNRQFRLQSGRNSSIQQTDSPSREIKPSAPSSYPSSNEEDEQLDWSDAIKRANIELEPPIRDAGTADQWIERNPGLIRLTGRHPFNSEPPLTRLMQSGFITPAAIHFVRNHGVVPRGSWQDWSVEVTGLVRRPKKFTMDELVSEFTSQEFPVTLVCAGNRRKEQNMTKQTIGFNWGPGAISTSVWRGIPLREVLLRCGIIMGTSMNVCFEGAEDLPGGGGSKYGTSVRAGIAMDPARDIIIAYMQNGEMLSPDHGFPVRMIIPGFIGGRMVKWLKRIVVSTEESDSYYHYKDNRVLPSHVDAELADAEAWWYKPEYIINELNINSVITRPSHQDILMINSSTAQKPYTLGGYAYSGGGRKVTRVEVTLDEGETWVAAELEHQEKPNKYGKYWCWCFWSLEVEVLHLLEASNIGVRAWDESLNIQPEKLIWNVMGMMNNCWFKVKTNVCKGPEEGEIGIVFEHPTQPGNKAGGWMAKERYLEYSMQVAPTMKKSLSSPFMNNAATKYPLSEVKNHNTADSCWIVVHGYVYDCTRFLNDHPGGSDSILINAGSDCTEEFDTIHSDKAKKLIQKYRIGELTWSSENEAGYALKKIPCRLIEKVSLSHDVRRFRLALPSGDLTLGLPVGKHVLLCDTIEGKLCMRAYTPTTTNEDGGYFDLVVKVYFKGEHPEYPSGGLMSQHLDSLPLGSTVKVKGPLGHIEYSGRGRFSAHGKHPTASRLAMIAGGTGITPIYQVMQSVLSDPGDQTVMYLVYANRTEDDIIMREELDGWAQDHPDRVNVWYVVQESVRVGWKYDIGLITESVLREHVPSGSHDTLALACGPPPMIQFAVIPNLKKMGYDINNDLLVF